MIVSILNQKGGCGKTTLAINIARYFTKFYPKVLLVDADPQGSARNWHEKGDGNLIRMVALDKPNTLSKGIEALKDDYDWIIIDGVPQLSNMTIAAIKCSDIVLIPVQPSPYDIWATSDTVQFVKDHQENFNGKPKAALLVSRKIVNTNIGRDIYIELEKYDLPILQHGTCQRIIYSDSASRGLTVLETQSKEAIKEIGNICLEIMGGN